MAGRTIARPSRETYRAGIGVFNFEVAGDHTYFVEDGNAAVTGDDFGVWVHNTCVGRKFFGSYKRKPVEFKNSSPGKILFRKRDPAEARAIRDAFDATERKNFVKHVATTRGSDLKAAGFSNKQIADMAAEGTVPDIGHIKFEVHHKHPIDGGGDNNFDNLVIVQKAPYHAALTTEQNRYVGDLGVGEERELDLPLFTGLVVYRGR